MRSGQKDEADKEACVPGRVAVSGGREAGAAEQVQAVNSKAGC